MFESPEIRTSFVNTIVDWIAMSYQMTDSEQIEYIRTELSALADEELYKAGEEIEQFEIESRDSLQSIERQILALEHSSHEAEEKSAISLPFFS